jgi:hypothetical protein
MGKKLKKWRKMILKLRKSGLNSLKKYGKRFYSQNEKTLPYSADVVIIGNDLISYNGPKICLSDI